MENLFVAYLVLNLLLEGLAAATLIGAGLGLITVAQLESGMWSMFSNAHELLLVVRSGHREGFEPTSF